MNIKNVNHVFIIFNFIVSDLIVEPKTQFSSINSVNQKGNISQLSSNNQIIINENLNEEKNDTLIPIDVSKFNVPVESNNNDSFQYDSLMVIDYNPDSTLQKEEKKESDTSVVVHIRPSDKEDSFKSERVSSEIKYSSFPKKNSYSSQDSGIQELHVPPVIYKLSSHQFRESALDSFKEEDDEEMEKSENIPIKKNSKIENNDKKKSDFTEALNIQVNLEYSDSNIYQKNIHYTQDMPLINDSYKMKKKLKYKSCCCCNII